MIAGEISILTRRPSLMGGTRRYALTLGQIIRGTSQPWAFHCRSSGDGNVEKTL